MQTTCDTCGESFRVGKQRKVPPEHCQRCRRKHQFAKLLDRDLPLVGSVFLDRERFEGYDSETRLSLSRKKKFRTTCVTCGSLYTAALVFEAKKKHPWNCKACAIRKEWQEPNYADSHRRSLKAAHNRPEVLLKHSDAQLRKWQDPEQRQRMVEALQQLAQDPAWREKVSDGLLRRWTEDPPKCSFGSRHSGRFTCSTGQQVYLRSSYEFRIAALFERRQVEFEVEQHPFQLVTLPKKTVYVPDFYLPEYDVHWEVKGFLYEDARAKWNAFRLEYPNVRAFMLFKGDLERLEAEENAFANYV